MSDIHLARPAADLHRLAAALTGRLWLPGEPRYDEKRAVVNERCTGVRPAAVVSAATVGDVRQAIRWAGDNGLAVTPRGTGHSFAGYSVGGGLVVDVSGLADVVADETSGLVTVGGGATMNPLYRCLEQHQMAFPAGNSPTVGIGGLTLGGGVAAVSRAWGLTSDALVETVLVTADGRVRTCNARENPDLFWACRGGGGGNFGVNVSFTFQARPVTDVSVCCLIWTGADAHAVALLDTLQEVVRQGPNEFSARLGLSTSGRGQAVTVSAVGLFLGPARNLRDLLRPALDVAPPTRQEVLDLSYWAGKDYLRHETSGGGFAVRTRLSPGPLPADALETLLWWIRRWPGSRNVDGAGVGLFAWGGAINAVPATDTAFVHRDSLFLVSMDTSWTEDDAPGQVDANLRWLTGMYEAMGEHLPDSAYQNFTDPDLPDWRTAYYGRNFPRLVDIKRRHDPDNLFRFDQSIPVS